MRHLEVTSDPVAEASNENYVLPRELKAGDTVLMVDLNKEATVLEAPKDGLVMVQAGIIKTRVEVKNLRLAEGKKQKPRPATRSVTKNVSNEAISTSLDLRGKNIEESLPEVDTFLDLLSRRNVPQCTIIHGKGTGVLRAGVQQFLRRHPLVKSYRLGTYGEGESGVTIVELK